MTATTDVEKRVLLLTGKSQTTWAFWMKARLLEKGLCRVVNTAQEKPKQCDAFDFVVSTISEPILSRILDAITAKDVWGKLRELYASTDASIVVAIEDGIHGF
jgi:hypothetical protein